MSKKNQYEQQSKKKTLLGAITETQQTKGSIKDSAIETGKDLFVGVILGGLAGAALGRSSLLIGALIAGVGHYHKSRMTSIFGVGMMAANGFQPKGNVVSGPDDKGFIAGAKDRVIAFKDTFSEKLFLDKLKKKKEEPPATAGIGDVQYFTYPQQNQLGQGEVDLTALDEIESQIAQSAAAYKNQQMTGMLPGNEGMDSLLDPSDRNY